MRWNRAGAGRFQARTGHGSGVQDAGWSAIRNPVAAGSRGCSIRVFGEGKLEIPVQTRGMKAFRIIGNEQNSAIGLEKVEQLD